MALGAGLLIWKARIVKPRVIAVVGMHRSGTSAMARALGYAGAALGDDFIETMPEVNAKGFWEDASLNRVNIEVLRVLGVDWLTNSPIPCERFDEPILSPLLNHAANLLLEKVRGMESFAFKDPRTSILLPFWKRVFALADIDAGYLIAIRHPASVADSLNKRDGFDPAKSIVLWLRYTVSSLRETGGATRVLVDYDLLMDRPVEELRRISSVLVLRPPTAEVEAEFSSRFLAPELRHCRADLRGLPANSRLPQPAAILFDALYSVAKGQSPFDAPLVQEAVDQAERFLADISPLLAYADRLEYAAALGEAPPEAGFPWLPVLRASFGLTQKYQPANGTGARLVPTDAFRDHSLPQKRLAGIVIAVFNAVIDLMACVDSVLKHTAEDVLIILVDDCSTDPRVAPLLAGWADQDPRIRILRTPSNLGFPGTANRGLDALPTDHDVVWLNSDTIVTPGWLDALMAALDEVPGSGIACPLSNNATILSAPRFNDGGPLADDWPADKFVTDIKAAAAGIAPFPIPTAVGFCMYVRRPVIEAVGGFDTAFSPGYGEECDYSLRTWRAGFSVIGAPQSIVLHKGESSFGGLDGIDEARRISATALDARWPGYRAAVQRFCLDNPQRPLLEEVMHRRRAADGQRLRILHVVHTGGHGGGVENHVVDLAVGCHDLAEATIVQPVYGNDIWFDVRELDEKDAARRIGLAVVGGSAKVETRFARFVAAHRPQVVHFHHLIGWSTYRLPQLAKDVGAAVVVTIHDYYLLCVNYNLVKPDGTNCAKEAFRPGEAECTACLKHFLRNAGRGAIRSFLVESPVERISAVMTPADAVIFPSQHVHERFRSLVGAEYDGKSHVVPHSLVPSSARVGLPASARRRQRGDGPLRVTFLGTYNHLKGSEVFAAAARRLRGKGFVFNVVGRVEDKNQGELGAAGIPWSGPYRREELPDLLTGSDVICVIPQWQETYCLAFDEALASGRIVVYTPVGGIPERAKPDRYTITVPVADADALVAALGDIRDGDLRHAIPVLRPAAGLCPEGSSTYHDLYRELARRCRPPPTPPPPEPALWRDQLLDGGLGRSEHQDFVDRLRARPVMPMTDRSQRFDVLVDARYHGDQAQALSATLASLVRFADSIGEVVVAGLSAPLGTGGSPLSVPLRDEANERLNPAIRSLGESWLLYLPAGEQLAAHWYEAMAAVLGAPDGATLAYWDDDLVTLRGEHYFPRFKPDFDPLLFGGRPDLLRGGFLAQRHRLLEDGGLHEEALAPALDIALAWHRRSAQSVRHVPSLASHVLDVHHWARLRREAAAGGIVRVRPSQALERREIAVVLLAQDARHAARVVNELLAQVGIGWTVIEPVWISDKTTLPEKLIDSTHPRVRSWRLAASLAEALAHPGAAQAAEWVLLVTDALNMERPDTIARLLNSGEPACAVVAPRLLASDSTLFAAGWLIGGGDYGVLSPFGRSAAREDSGYLGLLNARRRVGAVSGLCALIRRSVISAVGFSPEIQSTYVLADFCMRAQQAGWAIACAGNVDVFVLPHGQTEAGLPIPDAAVTRSLESDLMRVRWGDALAHDPAHNPNLGLRSQTNRPDMRFPVVWNGLPKCLPRIVAAPFDDWGCGHHRVREPLRILAEQREIEFVLLPTQESGYMPTVSELGRSYADVLFAHNPFNDYQIRSLEAYRRHLGIRIVVGMDDLLTDLPPYNAYSKTMYRDISERIAAVLALADVLIVSTEPLREAYGRLAPRCAVIPNALDLRRWHTQDTGPAPTSARRRMRVGWAGAANHGDDIDFLADVVRATKHAVDWVFFGMAPKGIGHHVAEIHAMVPFEEFPTKLRSLHLDVGLAPLARNSFNRAKSNLKFLEYGAARVAVISSKAEPYADTPALKLENDPNEWSNLIVELAANPQMLYALRGACHSWTVQHASLLEHVPDWMGAILAEP